MNVYVCQRWDEVTQEDWEGALIIAAHSEEEAVQLFRAEEYGDEPLEVHSMKDVTATGDPRILYDDYNR